MKVIGVIVMPRHSGLAVVGEDFDQVLVDEDAQGEILAFL